MQQGSAGMQPCGQTKGQLQNFRKEDEDYLAFFLFNRQLGCQKILGVKGAKPHWVNFFEEKRGSAFLS